MPVPTAQELVYLRQQPHRTDMYLSIYKPPTIWAAQVNDASITRGARVITFDNVTTSGSPVKGQTIYIGTTPGGKDKGTLFVAKPISGSTITVAENSHINWADNDYLTVVNFFQIWPIYPRIILNTGTSQTTVYMNYDEEYVSGTNGQNMQTLVMCEMGPHHAGFLDPATHQHSVHFVNVGVDGTSVGYSTGTTTASFSWIFEGGTPTGTTSNSPNMWVTWNQPGHYTVSLTYTNAWGKAFTSYRHISIYDRPDHAGGTVFPIMKWGLENLSGSQDDGGYRAKIWVEQDVSDIVDGALVVLFTDDWYGTTKVSVNANTAMLGDYQVPTDRLGIFFIGYILNGSIQYDYQRSRITFEVGSPTIVAKQSETFAVSLEDSTNPDSDTSSKYGSPWFYRYGLTIRTGLYHYLYWHTTLNMCSDVYFVYSNNDNQIQYFDVNKASIYDALQSFAQSSFYGNVISDRLGKVWIDEIIPPTGGVVFLLDKTDWIGEIKITENQINSISQLEVGGIIWSGIIAGSISTPILSVAPGTPAYQGTTRKISGIALPTQAELNTLAGDIYANLNARYSEVVLDLAGNYQNIEIVCQYTNLIRVSLSASDNNRGISWVAKPFKVKSVNWRYEKNLLRPTITLQEIASGFDGTTVVL